MFHLELIAFLKKGPIFRIFLNFSDKCLHETYYSQGVNRKHYILSISKVLETLEAMERIFSVPPQLQYERQGGYQ